MKFKYIIYSAFIVTPLQYLLLLEYLFQNKINYNQCNLVILSHNQNTVDQIKTIFDTKKFKSFSSPMIKCKYQILNFLFTFYILKRKLNAKIIVGNYNNTWCVYALQRSNRDYKSVILDDGAATLPNLYKRSNYDFRVELPSYRNLMGLFQIIVLRLKKTYKKKLEFFTIFSDVKGLNYDYVVKNNLEQLKTKIVTGTFSQEIWIIGTPLIKLGLISENEYNRILAKIIDLSDKKKLKIKYFLHRVEPSFNSDNIEIISNQMPFELQYLNQKCKPKYIISFYSSALLILSKLEISSKLISVEIGNDIRLKSEEVVWRNIDQVYDYIENDGNIKQCIL